MTNLGLPSSSILGKEGGGVFWNWRACIPLLPFASTTNMCLCLCWGFWVIVLEENSECFTNTSSCVLEFDKGSRTSAFRDMLASIFCSLYSQFSVCLCSMGFFLYCAVDRGTTHQQCLRTLIHTRSEMSQGMGWDTRSIIIHSRGIW